jgi:hypothetical protein
MVVSWWRIRPLEVSPAPDARVEQDIPTQDHQVVLYRCPQLGCIPLVMGLLILAVAISVSLKVGTIEPGLLLLGSAGLLVTMSGIWLMRTPTVVLDRSRRILGYHKYDLPLHHAPVSEALAPRRVNNWIELKQVKEIVILRKSRYDDDFASSYSLVLRGSFGSVEIVERTWQRTVQRIANILAELCRLSIGKASEE